MATRRGGETVSARQYDFHKRYTHRLLAHPGYQALSFERKGIYTHLYDLAFCANDDGAIRIGLGDRFTRRRLVEFLAMQQAGPSSDPGACMAWAKQAVDALCASELIKVDTAQIVWVVNYVDEQERISPAGMRKREQREREEAARRGGAETPYIEEPGAGGSDGDGLRPRRPVQTRPPPPVCPPSNFDDPFDAGSDASPRVGQSRDSHDQSQSQNQRGTYVPQNSESESEQSPRRFAGSEPPARFDGRPLNGGQTGGGGREDLYALNPIDAACRVTGEHGAWMANTARKVDRELGTEVLWSIIAEVADARRDNLIRAKRPDGTITGGPLFNKIAERHRERMKAQAGVRQMSRGFGFGAEEHRS